MLQYVERTHVLRRDVLQCVAICCNMLQYVAMWCSVLQHVVICCSMLSTGMSRVRDVLCHVVVYLLSLSLHTVISFGGLFSHELVSVQKPMYVSST